MSEISPLDHMITHNRPPKKDVPFRLVMTQAEKDKLKHISDHYGVTQSEAIRQMVASAYSMIHKKARE